MNALPPIDALAIQDATVAADRELRTWVLQVCREASRSIGARRMLVESGIESVLPRADPVWPLVHLLAEMERRGEPADYGATLAACQQEPGFAGAALDEADRLPPTTQLEWYVGRVREAFAKRRAAEDLTDVASACCNGTPPPEIAGRIRAIAERLESADESEQLQGLDLSAPPPAVRDPLVGDEKQQLLMPGEVCVIAADPGVGKTKLLTEVALAVASGGQCLGFPTQQRSVLLVTSDGDPEFERNLHRQWEGRGSEVSLAGLPLTVVPDDDFCLEEPVSYARLRKTLEKMTGPVTLILESLATNVTETDLNDQVGVRQFVRKHVRSLMSHFPDLTVVISCHLRKPQQGGSNDLGTRVAGSVQIRGAVDCVLGLVPVGRDAFVVRRIKRSRSGAQFEPFQVQIRGDHDGPLSLENEGPLEVPVEEARGAAGAVLDFMRCNPGRRSLKEIVAGIPGFRTRAIQKACKRLSDGDRPQLARIGSKPAAYELPPQQEPLDLGGID